MNENTINIIQSYIDQISKSLGVATDKVLPILIRQQVTEGIIWIIVTLLMIVLSIFFLKMYNRFILDPVLEKKKNQKYEWHDEAPGLAKAGMVVCYVLIFASILGFLLAFPTNLTKILNPEYHVLKDLLYMVQGSQ